MYRDIDTDIEAEIQQKGRNEKKATKVFKKQQEGISTGRKIEKK